jgi:hypothetical protein
MPISFSTDTSGNLLIQAGTPGTFPMAGYRRSFSSAGDLAQFCIANLGARPIYNSAGNLIGVEGMLISKNYSSYRNRSGQLVMVQDPILSFLGGTTGTLVVGNQLWNLQATTVAQAFTTVTSAPVEDVWSGPPPSQGSSSSPSSQSSSSLLAASKLGGVVTSLLGDGGCGGHPPQCTTPDGRLGYLTCDYETGFWDLPCNPNQIAPLSVSVNAPTTFRAPLGTYATFRGTIYDPVIPQNNNGMWTAPAGSGSVVQFPLANNFYTDVRFYPYSPFGATLTFTSQKDPTKSATATVLVPQGQPLQQGEPFADHADACVSGDGGMRACVSGQTYHHNFVVYRDRGSRSDYLVCGVDTGNWWMPASGCYIKDNPGPNVSLNVNANFYFAQPGTGLPVFVYSRGSNQTNVGHVDGKAYRVFFGVGVSDTGGIEGPPPIPEFSVDRIAGVCATHGASGNLSSKTSQDSYIRGCLR